MIKVSETRVNEVEARGKEHFSVAGWIETYLLHSTAAAINFFTHLLVARIYLALGII